jgi:hypothetical protein
MERLLAAQGAGQVSRLIHIITAVKAEVYDENVCAAAARSDVPDGVAATRGRTKGPGENA